MADVSGEQPSVLVTYAHGDDDHTRKVILLARLLRDCSIDVHLDQVARDSPTRWPQWMESQIKQADFVLIVGSSRYAKGVAAAKQEADNGLEQVFLDGEHGRGVRWEWYCLKELAYDHPLDYARRVLPVLLPGSPRSHLPEDLLSPSKGEFRIGRLTPAGISDLVDRIFGRFGLDLDSVERAPADGLTRSIDSADGPGTTEETAADESLGLPVAFQRALRTFQGGAGT